MSLEPANLEANNLESAAEHLKAALNSNPNSPIARVMELSIAEFSKNTSEHQRLIAALDVQDKLIVSLELANLAMINGSWEELNGHVQNVLSTNPDCIQALFYEAAHIFTACKDPSKCLAAFLKVQAVIEKHYNFEQAGVDLLVDLIVLVNRIAGFIPGVQSSAIGFLERAAKIGGNKFSLTLEIGNCYLLNGELEKANKSFREAAKLDPSSSDPLLKLLEVQILKRELDEAQASVDFLKEIFSSMKNDRCEFYFSESQLHCLIAMSQPGEKQESMRQAIQSFEEGLKIYLTLAKKYPNNLLFYRLVDPAHTLSIVRFYLGDDEWSASMVVMGL